MISWEALLNCKIISRWPNPNNLPTLQKTPESRQWRNCKIDNLITFKTTTFSLPFFIVNNYLTKKAF